MKVTVAIRPKINNVVLPLLLGIAVSGSVLVLQTQLEYGSIFLISAIVLIASGCLMHKMVAVFDLRRLSIPGFWYFAYLAVVFVPSFFVFLEQIHPARYAYLFAIVISLLTVPAGILLSVKILRFKKSEIEKFFTKPISTKGHVSFVLSLSAFQIAAVSFAMLYFREVGTVPLVYAIQNPGDYLTLVTLREQSFKLLDSRFSYLYFLLRQFVFPILISLTLGLYLVSRRTWVLIVLAVMVFVGASYAAASLIRGPVVVIFISMFFFWYFYRRGDVNLPIVVPLALVQASILPVLIFYLHDPERYLSSTILGIFLRVFKAPAEVLYYYFEAFPYTYDYLYGRSIGKVALFVNVYSDQYEFFDVGNYVFNYMFPGAFIKTGTAAAPFVGDLYANLGMPGVIAGGVVLGFVMQSLQIWIYRQRRKDILLLTVQAVLVYSFFETTRTALTSVLLSYGGITVPLFFYIYRYTQRLLELRW
jgi:oligosaccharide repeat unit polymerase